MKLLYAPVIIPMLWASTGCETNYNNKPDAQPRLVLASVGEAKSVTCPSYGCKDSVFRNMCGGGEFRVLDSDSTVTRRTSAPDVNGASSVSRSEYVDTVFRCVDDAASLEKVDQSTVASE